MPASPLETYNRKLQALEQLVEGLEHEPHQPRLSNRISQLIPRHPGHDVC